MSGGTCDYVGQLLKRSNERRVAASLPTLHRPCFDRHPVASCEVRHRVRFNLVSVVQVRMAPDLLTAYILWDAPPDRVKYVERELRQR